MTTGLLTPERLDAILQAYNERNKASSSKHVTVHRAVTRQELDQVVDVTTKAFMDYPLNMWITEDLNEEDHKTFVAFSARIVQRICRSNGYILIARNEQGEVVGGAQFENRVPSANALSRAMHDLYMSSMTYGSIFFGRTGLPNILYRSNLSKFQRRMNCFDHFKEPHAEIMGHDVHHIYLIMLSADPAQKKTGIGRTILGAFAEIEKAFGIPTYLETNDDQLQIFYEKNGFQAKKRFEIPDPDGPFSPTIVMVRSSGNT